MRANASLRAADPKHTFRLFLLDLLTVLENFIAAPLKDSWQQPGRCKCRRLRTAEESRVVLDHNISLGFLEKSVLTFQESAPYLLAPSASP